MTSSMTASDHTQVPVWITQAARSTAERFAAQQPTPDQAERVHQNTLVVSVVNDYLKLVGLQTQLEASDSWHPVLRLANPVADLAIAGYGRVECCPVAPTDTVFEVPLAAQCDRIAYIVVRLEAEAEATLLGFTTQTSESLSLSPLRPMAEFPSYLAQLDPVVDLRQWLEGIYQQEWQPPETLLRPKQLALSYVQATVQRAKQIALNLESAHRDAILLLSITPQAEALSVRVQLHPAIVADGAASGTRLIHSTLDCLIPNLTLALHTAEGHLAKVATSRTFPRDNCIQLPPFQGQWGERFTIRVTIGDRQIHERFQL